MLASPRRGVVLLVALTILVAAACGNEASGGAPTSTVPAQPTIEPSTVTITGGGVSEVVRVEFARTPLERQTGLMHRDSMDEDAGMLFIFPTDVMSGFWMRNTLIQLDIAHIAADGAILEINTREPLDETVLSPKQSYRYTLEVNGGWFEAHGLGVGAKVTFPADLPGGE